MKNGFFGKLFDLNNNGRLDAGEQFIDFMLFNELMGEENSDRDDGTDEYDEDEAWQSDAEANDCGIDPYDFDSPEEYNDAVAEKEMWLADIPYNVRDFADRCGIDPTDYNDYEDFADALRSEI